MDSYTITTTESYELLVRLSTEFNGFEAVISVRLFYLGAEYTYQLYCYLIVRNNNMAKSQ